MTGVKREIYSSGSVGTSLEYGWTIQLTAREAVASAAVAAVDWMAAGGTPGHARPGRCIVAPAQHHRFTTARCPRRCPRHCSKTWRCCPMGRPSTDPRCAGGLPRCSESGASTGFGRTGRPATAMRDRSGMAMLLLKTMRPASPPPLSLAAPPPPAPSLAHRRSCAHSLSFMFRVCAVCVQVDTLFQRSLVFFLSQCKLT